MIGNEAFLRLLNFLGQGNPIDALAFVGIEGGDGSGVMNRFNDPVLPNKQDLLIDILGEELYHSDTPCCWENHRELREGDKLSPMWIVASKICVGLSNEDWLNRDVWRPYLFNNANSHKICYTNLFPLEKKSLNHNHSSKVFELFEITKEHYAERLNERYTLLRSELQNSKAIICYGKGYWHTFKHVFDLDKPELDEKYIQTFPERKIILTKHLSMRYSTSLTEQVINILKGWEVSL